MNNSSKLKLLKHIHKFDEKLMNTVTFISILYMIFLIIELYLPQSQSIITFIVIVDTIICLIFLFEFFYLFSKAKNKLEYTKKNYLDLLASLPFLLLLGAFPQIALLNIFKMIRGFKSILKVYEYLGKKEFSALTTTIIVFVLTIIYFSISIVYFEGGSNPAIQSFHDGLWWAVVTITTVGYGDAIPITFSGKIIAMLLMLFGVGITSALSAIIVSYLLKPSQEKLLREEKKINKKEDLDLKRDNLLLKKEKNETAIETKLLSKINHLEKKIDLLGNKSSKKKKSKTH